MSVPLAAASSLAALAASMLVAIGIYTESHRAPDQS